LTEAFHSHLIDLLRRYYFTGGMPEPVKHFAETGNGGETRKIQDEIIKSYTLDFLCEFEDRICPKDGKIGNLPLYGISLLANLF